MVPTQNAERWLRDFTNAFRGAGLTGALLLNLALEMARLDREFLVFCLHQKGVEAAAMIDRFQRIGRNAQPYRAVERIGDERDVAQIGQEPPLGLAVGVAHLMASLRRLSGQITPPRHGASSSSAAARSRPGHVNEPDP